MTILQIIVTAIITMALLWGEHYTPWYLFLGKELPRPAAYTLGMLACILPVTGLYIVWSLDPPTDCLIYAAAALWVDVALGGLTIYVLYGLDALKMTIAEREMERRVNEVWRNDQNERSARSAAGRIGEPTGKVGKSKEVNGGTTDQDDLYLHG